MNHFAYQLPADYVLVGFAHPIANMVQRRMAWMDHQRERFLCEHLDLFGTHVVIEYPAEFGETEYMRDGKIRVGEISQLIALVPTALARNPIFVLPKECAIAEYPHIMLSA